MDKLKNAVLKTAAKATEKMAISAAREWPPGCFGPIYQPVRPNKLEEADVTPEDK